MKPLWIYFFVLTLLLTDCSLISQPDTRYESKTLKIIPLKKNVYRHVSYIPLPEIGDFPCNGMIYIKRKEAIIFDTPLTDEVSEELINWLSEKKGVKVKGVIINHFHDDCLGGLEAFHKRGIPSYANLRTAQMAAANNLPVPQITFLDSLQLNLSDSKVITTFFGEAHTRDNVISYLPSESVVFGGCQIKSLNAGKGNLKDANIDEWPVTVKKVKEAYQNVSYVIPGHGKPGGPELFDYTIELFKKTD